jgi:hypothetical protein
MKKIKILKSIPGKKLKKDSTWQVTFMYENGMVSLIKMDKESNKVLSCYNKQNWESMKIDDIEKGQKLGLLVIE